MRACDRCHQVKERCSKPKESDVCARCLRLHLQCNTIRPQKRNGRVPSSARPITYEKLATSSQPSAIQRQDCVGPQESTAQRPSPSDEACSPETLSHITEATDQERYWLSLALGDKKSAGRYVIGPSFHERHQKSLIKGLQTAPALLKDAFISCSTLIAAEQGIEVPASVQEQCQQRAAVGVSVLRSVKVTNQEDAASCILLGFLLITFAKYVALGEVLAICRYTLNQIKPIYEAKANFFNEDDRCFLRHLVLTETVECLFQAEMPALRLENEQGGMPDRFLGVSSSLLPTLHSLACLNSMARKGDGVSRWKSYQEAIKLEISLLDWTPAPKDNLRNNFEPQEVNYMLRQAKVMKETMLLIAHRLQFTYGSRTPTAEQLCQSIREELELLKAENGQTLHIAGLSLMAAAFEVDVDDSTGQAKALDRLERLTSLSPSFRSRLQRSLLKIWSAKEQQRAEQKCWYWYDVSRCYLSPSSDS